MLKITLFLNFFALEWFTNKIKFIAEENKKTQVFETKIKDCDAQIKEYENKKISILKDAKICPVCAQIIPDDFGGHIHE